MVNKNRISSGLTYGIPTLGRPVSLEWALSFHGMSAPINYNTIFQIVRNKEVAEARNIIAKQAVDNNSKYLFFLGDDVICPPHALRQLIFRMENSDASVVGGVYCSKSDIPAPLVFKGNGSGSYWDWKVGEFFRCSGLGMDCTLIRVDVLKDISFPWFKTIDSNEFLDGENKSESWTEDLYFFNKLEKETDHKVYCDASVICKHVDIYNDKVYELPKNSKPCMHKIATEGLPKCLMIGPKIDLDMGYDVTLVNQTEEADYRGQWDNLPFDSLQFDFIVSTEPRLTVEFPIEEWERLCKPDGKIAFTCDKFINLDMLSKKYNGIIDGDFVVVEKTNGASRNNAVGC